MDEEAPSGSRCARCGGAFRCGIDDAGGCWCARLPPAPLERLDAGAGCLCPTCLALLTGAQAHAHDGITSRPPRRRHAAV